MAGEVLRFPSAKRRSWSPWRSKQQDEDPHILESTILFQMVQILFGAGLHSAARHRILRHLCEMQDERQETECSYPDMNDGSGA